ncbi:hypothetical protein L207DRAFT_534180 [Hyaloscypha variabilis F]|uniref:Uncharacterized protein n=1 Tax=Hyaloscypha variabilis (strain UAMH 11265 / GT02V1 / F) TaxID=1149755 RepID=A0A2J6R8Q6_HYAVF|nr:hypothetical protein L207DRAFT_534180 [Hyaloscypha variabilis F]
MTDPKLHQGEDDFPLTEEELRRVPTLASRFTEHFTPPPNYPSNEAHEMKNFPLPNSGASPTYNIHGTHTGAREEAFNFQFFAPKKNMRRYLIALIIILILIIIALAILSGLLSHQLSQAHHESHMTTLTVTMTEQLRFTAVQPTTFVTLTRSLSSSTLDLTQTETQTETQVAFASPSPTPSPMLDTSPHATCSAVSRPSGGVDVSIWVNYIDSQEQVLALAVALDKQCDAQIDISGWTASASDQTWSEADGSLWVADTMLAFQLKETAQFDLALSKSLRCVPQGIVEAGGPSDTPDCG